MPRGEKLAGMSRLRLKFRVWVEEALEFVKNWSRTSSKRISMNGASLESNSLLSWWFQSTIFTFQWNNTQISSQFQHEIHIPPYEKEKKYFRKSFSLFCPSLSLSYSNTTQRQTNTHISNTWTNNRIQRSLQLLSDAGGTGWETLGASSHESTSSGYEIFGTSTSKYRRLEIVQERAYVQTRG